MLTIDILRLATRMFRTNRSRTILTILGISVGIGAILLLVSLGYGLQRLILNQITTSDALLSLDVTTGGAEGLKLNKQSIKEIKEIDGVDKVSPLITMQAQMTIDDIASELAVNFADSEFFVLEGINMKKGDTYTDSEDDKHKIIISSSALQLFNIGEDEAVGKKVKFTLFLPETEQENNSGFARNYLELPDEYEIYGIVDEDASNFVYMPYANSANISFDSYSKIKVKVISDNQLETVRTALIDKGFMVSALSDIIEQANQVFRIVQIVLASFGIVALVVSAIGMFNTMTIALLERTQEIGIMKALGATGLDIWKMFLAEAVIIGFLGGAGGIIIGMAGGEVFNYGINLLASAVEGGGNKVDLFYTPYWFIILIITFATLVGFFTGFYPARRAARINCLEALRYK